MTPFLRSTVASLALAGGLLTHPAAAQPAAPKLYVGLFKDNSVAVIDA
jgi:hypothetical protein